MGYLFFAPVVIILIVGMVLLIAAALELLIGLWFAKDSSVLASCVGTTGLFIANLGDFRSDWRIELLGTVSVIIGLVIMWWLAWPKLRIATKNG